MAIQLLATQKIWNFVPLSLDFKKIKDKIYTVKIGLELFNAHGKEGVRKFNEIGIMTKRGRLTVFHNGILVQINIEILGTTEFIGMPKIGKNEISGYMGKEVKKVLYIQDHGNPVSYRNIWLRKL